jgi:hypothetical protein
MPLDSAERKNTPLVTGVLDYFPAALAAVARLSKFGNDKHNPGEPLNWARGKSMDHADCIGRHLVDRGIIDPETKMSHTVEIAWRALAMLQLEEEANGAPLPRGATLPSAPAHIVITPKAALLPWDAGWKCECGSTKVWRGHNYYDQALLPSGKGPLCDNARCSSRMTRG